jgi:hypothetical protein
MDLDADDVIAHLPCSVVALPPPQMLGSRHQDRMSLEKQLRLDSMFYVAIRYYVKLKRTIDQNVPATANFIAVTKTIPEPPNSHHF